MIRKLGLVAAVLMAFTLVANAGEKWTVPLFIYKYSDGSGQMSGTLAGTRSSADAVQRFGCYYESVPPTAGGYKHVTCYAYDGTKSLSCGTYDATLADTISRVAGDTYLWIAVDAAGNCTRVQLGFQSLFAPKAP